MVKKLRPMHPGEVLRESSSAASNVGGRPCQGLRAPGTRIDRITDEQVSIFMLCASPRGRAPLGTTAQLWLNLQTDYDVQQA